MNEFVVKHGLISKDNVMVYGSVTSSLGFCGTASATIQASSASYVDNGNGTVIDNNGLSSNKNIDILSVTSLSGGNLWNITDLGQATFVSITGQLLGAATSADTASLVNQSININTQITVTTPIGFGYTQVFGSGNFNDSNNYTLVFDLYAVKNTPGGTIYSLVNSLSFFESGAVNPYYLTLNWDVDPTVDSYKLYLTDPYNGYIGDYYILVTGNTVDYGTGIESTATQEFPRVISPNSYGAHFVVDNNNGNLTTEGDINAGGNINGSNIISGSTLLGKYVVADTVNSPIIHNGFNAVPLPIYAYQGGILNQDCEVFRVDCDDSSNPYFTIGNTNNVGPVYKGGFIAFVRSIEQIRLGIHGHANGGLYVTKDGNVLAGSALNGAFSGSGLWVSGLISGSTLSTSGVIKGGSIQANVITASTSLLVGPGADNSSVTFYVSASNRSNNSILEIDDCYGSECFRIDASGSSVHSGSGIFPLQLFNNINNESEFFNANLNSGITASVDIVCFNDQANTGSYTAGHYVDLGINSSGYGYAFIGKGNDSYLFSTGSNSSSLYIGHLDRTGSVYLFAGGYVNSGSGLVITSQSVVINVPSAGIGTLTPTAKLHIAGVNTTDTLLKIYNSASNPTMVISGTFVGIGTATPTNTLDVVGNAYVRGTGNSLYIDSLQGYTSNWITFGDGTNKYTWEMKNAMPLTFVSCSVGIGSHNFGVLGSGPTAKLHISGTVVNDGLLKIDDYIGNSILFISGSNNNFGIGTATPSAKLHVYGNAYIGGNNITSDVIPSSSIIMGGNAFSGSTVNMSGSNLVLAGGIGKNYFTIFSGSVFSGSTVSIVVNGITTTLIASSSFNISSSNYVTAFSMSAAINAISGITSTISASSALPTGTSLVFVTPKIGTYALSLYTTAGPTTASVTSKNGNVGVGTNVTLVPLTVSMPVTSSYYTKKYAGAIGIIGINSGTQAYDLTTGLYFGQDNMSLHQAGSGYIQQWWGGVAGEIAINPNGGGVTINGIGTANVVSPHLGLTVNGNTSQNAFIKIANTTGFGSTGKPYTGLIFQTAPASYYTYEKGAIVFDNSTDAAGYSRGDLKFCLNGTADGSNVTDTISTSTAMTIKFSSLNVGIGTISPVNRLDVSGNISCSVITASLLRTGGTTTGSTAPVTLQGYYQVNVGGTNYWTPYYSSP